MSCRLTWDILSEKKCMNGIIRLINPQPANIMVARAVAWTWEIPLNFVTDRKRIAHPPDWMRRQIYKAP